MTLRHNLALDRWLRSEPVCVNIIGWHTITWWRGVVQRALADVAVVLGPMDAGVCVIRLSRVYWRWVTLELGPPEVLVCTLCFHEFRTRLRLEETLVCIEARIDHTLRTCDGLVTEVAHRLESRIALQMGGMIGVFNIKQSGVTRPRI